MAIRAIPNMTEMMPCIIAGPNILTIPSNIIVKASTLSMASETLG